MIEVRKIAKTLSDGFVLRDISFALERSRSLVLLGPSGCGKTTLLRLVAGLETPDSGEIRIDGKTVSGPGWATEPHTRGIGFVFQSPALWPHMTVERNILFGLDALNRKEKHERLRELIGNLGLDGLEKRYPDRISKGEARRVSIARSLGPGPSILLMDEALSNLDVDTRQRVMEFIKREIEQTGALLIFVTHDKEEADFIGGDRLYMRAGRLVG